MQYKAVLFDMDGLLFDTELIMYQAYVAFCKRKNVPYDFDIFKLLLGLNAVDGKTVIDTHYQGRLDYHELFAYGAKYRQEYIQTYGLPIKKGFFQLRNYCIRHQLKLGLVTSSKLKVVQENLNATSLFNTFDVIISGENVIHSKPSPEIYQLALHKLNLKPNQALVLEDSESGIKAAYNAQIDVICIPDLVKHKPQINAVCVAILDSLDQVINYIK